MFECVCVYLCMCMCMCVCVCVCVCICATTRSSKVRKASDVCVYCKLLAFPNSPHTGTHTHIHTHTYTYMQHILYTHRRTNTHIIIRQITNTLVY